MNIEEKRKIWRENQRKYRKKNRKKLLSYGRENYSRWNKRHKEYQRLYYAKKRNAPKELILKYEKEFLKRKEEKLYEKNIRLFFNNLFIFHKYHKKKIGKYTGHNNYIEKNREKWNKYISNYINNKIKTDPKFKLTVNLRKRLVRALKGIIKSDTTMNLVGCSREYLINYIESQFDDEMSWSAYLENKIHIDHILPCSSFDLTKEEEQRKCFNYTNLQPLWARDNISKGNKIMTVSL